MSVLAQLTRFRCLFAILLVGLFLRAWPLGESLWIDELHTAWTVAGDWSDVAPRARLGNNGPLYFWLVYGVTQITGLHEWSLRLVSFLAGGGLILATYAVARKWRCSPSTCLLAAGLVAIDAHAIYYSCEARTYALVQLLAIAHMYLFWRWVTSRQAGVGLAAAWLITALLLFHLHCTTALVFLAEMVAYLTARLSLPLEVKLSRRALLAGFGAVAVGTLPATGLLREVAQRRENWELFVAQRPFMAVLDIYPLATYVLAPLVASACVWAATRFFRKQTGQGQGPSEVEWVPLILCASWLMVPVAAAWLATESDVARLFFRRYVIASSVALAPLTTLLLRVTTRSRPPIMAAIAVALIALVTISPAKYAQSGLAALSPALSHSGENWRDAIALLADDPADVPVLLRSGLIEADDWSRSEDPHRRAYCLLPIRGIYRLPPQDAPVIPLPTSVPVRLSAAEEERLNQYERVWLVIRDSRDGRISKDVVREVLAELESRFTVKHRYKFGLVSVVEIVEISAAVATGVPGDGPLRP